MIFACQGGPASLKPANLAEAKRLCEFAKAEGHTGVKPTLDAINKAEAEQLAKEYADADAMMAQLLAEDSEEKKAKSATKSKKSAKKKKSAPTVAETAAASDVALRDAMAAGDLKSLSAAIEANRESASEAVLSEAVEQVAAVEKERAAAEQAAKLAAAEKA